MPVTPHLLQGLVICYTNGNIRAIGRIKSKTMAISPKIQSLQEARGDITSIIDLALAEDIGTGDITSELLIPVEVQAEMLFVAREPMVACGLFVPGMVYERLKAMVTVENYCNEVQGVAKDTKLLKINGPARALLTGERVALNLMQRMCGVATLTRRYVDAVAGTKAVILDTRKTMPGMRAVDKYAVRIGGGQNHRMGLFDMVMVKDNHIAMRIRDSGYRIQELMDDLRKKLSSLNPESRILPPIIVECDTYDQVLEALAAKPDRILLDNMDLATMRRAVEMVGGRVPLEASGGVSLETVRGIAETGVDYISVGKLTHSAPNMDIGADIIYCK